MPCDDSVSLAASDTEDWSGSVEDPALSPSQHRSISKAGVNAELIPILTKAVSELGLYWASPEEPARSRLDEWFLLGRQQAPRQRTAPFFPEVHEELVKSWRTSYSVRLRFSSLSVLSTIDGAGEKGYERLPPLEEAVAAHLCPPLTIGWKAKVSYLSKLYRMTSALAGRA